MIYGDEIIQEIEYKLIAKEISILFGNVLLEDVHATYSTKKNIY